MFYLSQLIGVAVEDLNGQRIGKIADILIPAAQVGQPGPTYPSALLVEGQADQPWRIPIDAVAWHDNVLRLRIPVEQLTVQPVQPSAQELSLAQEVLDKQVIDIVHKKAVRVNDVSLGDDWQLQGIDNSTLGLVRRLAPSWLLGAIGKGSPASFIPWQRIELIGYSPPEQGAEQEISAPRTATPSPAEAVPLTQVTGEATGITAPIPRTPSGHLAELHPADIADIVHQLTPGQGARLLEGLDNETAADALEEIDTERQTQILENISADRAADILEAMGPDEAADLLARLPEERAQQLLDLMRPEESEDVQDLLKYEENSAGGLMTTDYVALNSTSSVAEALEAVRSSIREQDIRTPYVYCVADASQDDCLVLGVVSLWDLLVAAPTQRLEELMETDIISVRSDADPPDVAEIMAKYNLLAVPVLSAEGILEGVVTVDDALDVLLPAGRRRKPSRMY